MIVAVFVTAEGGYSNMTGASDDDRAAEFAAVDLLAVGFHYDIGNFLIIETSRAGGSIFILAGRGRFEQRLAAAHRSIIRWPIPTAAI